MYIPSNPSGGGNYVLRMTSNDTYLVTLSCSSIATLVKISFLLL